MAAENSNEKKEMVLAKIQQIVKDESFKVDAFFFCGFPGGTPNEKLKKTCESYLEAVKNNKADKKLVNDLILEMEAAKKILQAERPDTLVNNIKDIQMVLDNKAYL